MRHTMNSSLLCRYARMGTTRSNLLRSASIASATQQVLTEEQVAHFKSEGYVAVEKFWSEREIKAVRKALTKLQVDGRLANVACEGDGKTHTKMPQNLQLCPISPELPIFRSLPLTVKTGRAMSQLLCDNPSESVHCYLSQTFWKPARHGLGTGWHQDNAYFQIPENPNTGQCDYGTAMWIAIHDATVENGTLEVAQGHHRQGVFEHVRDGSSDHHITCAAHVDESKAKAIEIPAGGVIFFNYNMPHCTRANSTDKARAGLAYHFLASKQYTFRKFPLPEDVEYITPIVCGDKYTAGQAEYGFKVDTWEADVEEMLALEIDDEVIARRDATEIKATTVKQDM
eukprot:gnl/TRDRNA2_/TRDRNA2_73753_c1_seq1.p1 gnl/TRDRNA2_/TRDRNA2_73753_c1~~gnl/TRDRNA2_/TRDRNA2_73753_c1_seq1.p1  ORF type:complete len:342 (-),score=62.93 gnl/TRDRNA2_/TRDRNA2_73753_c1_seq1:194-1219(-)